MLVPIFRRQGENKQINKQTNKSKEGSKIEPEEKEKNILLINSSWTLTKLKLNGKEEDFFCVPMGSSMVDVKGSG